MGKDLSAYKKIRLGDDLRSWRLENSKTLAEATAGLKGWDAARLSKVERALLPITAADLAELLDHCGITGQEREEMEGLLEDGPSRRWWRNFDDTITAAFAEYLGLEAEAAHMTEYFPSGFPGIVQTEGYAQEMIAAAIDGPSEEQIEAATEVRMLRQRRLIEAPVLTVELYFGEVTLLVAGDLEVLAEQIRHAIKVARYPNVTLRMVPLSAGRAPILISGVTLLRFPQGADAEFVFIEAVGGMLPRRSGRDVRRAERAFTRVKRYALSPEETITALERKLEEIT
ncbi:DUF5753 domain-containing protein [Kitasatospora kifunensis]|uniref:DUF5753 domain-containing protein n=1 Tax=Kitasatospora kifunensis TaxID=58351 RepID=A0A7W7R672_KITKI|nr:DUF5753 domain-containing protein [Kitasatospora kifunensis]MBB4926045.1 hypothetical protein [Kitasatospora kifunensis]